MRRVLSHLAWQRFGLALLLLAAGSIPAFASDFQLFRLTAILVYAIALLGLNILTGYNGQISLGHGAFYSAGAYVAALIMANSTLPHWLALPVAGGICLAAGCLFAWPLVRLPNVQFALVTFALAVTAPQLANYKGIARWTGGSQGLGLDKPQVPFDLPLSYDQWIYLLTLLVLVVLLAAAANLLSGRIGRALMAIRDHPVAAEVAGIRIVSFKTLAFGVSAMVTGVAGALSAMALLYAAPAGVFLSLSFLIGSAVGGIASLSGAIYGALFLQLILMLTGFIARAAETSAVLAVYGVVVIAFLHFLPAGVAGGVASLAAWARGRLRRLDGAT
ncbi:MAG TPA: branched-chain amino acid ABC transporter permease [Burkholderiales bacterium]